MQQRLVDLLVNPEMVRVNQQYSASAAFAGGRIWTLPGGKELWAKPLEGGSAAVVLFNRGGHTPPCSVNAAIEAPCDDDPSLPDYWGAQTVAMRFGDLPSTWLFSDEPVFHATGLADVECDVFDVFATAAAGKAIGRHAGGFEAMIPPHGVRFLILSGCSPDSAGTPQQV